MTESTSTTGTGWRPRIWSAVARIPLWALVVLAILLLFAATAWGLLRPIIRERQAIQRLEGYPDVKVFGGSFTKPTVYVCGFSGYSALQPSVWGKAVARLTGDGTWQPEDVTVYLRRGTPTRALGELTSLRQIGEINLVGRQWTDRDLAFVVDTLRMKRLTLSRTSMTANGLKALENRSFEELDVSEQPIGPEFFRAVRSMTRLKSLSLKGDLFAVSDLSLLAGQPRMSSLWIECEDLASNSIEVFATLPELTELYLDGSGIDDVFLRELGRLPKTVSLSVADTKITDVGLASIPASVHLETLNVDQTAITEAGLLSLKAVPKTLSLVGTKVQVTEPLKRWFLSHSFDEVALDESQLDPTSPTADELSSHIGFLNITPAPFSTGE